MHHTNLLTPLTLRAQGWGAKAGLQHHLSTQDAALSWQDYIPATALETHLVSGIGTKLIKQDGWPVTLAAFLTPSSLHLSTHCPTREAAGEEEIFLYPTRPF